MGYDYSKPLQFLAKLLVPFGLIGKATDWTNIFYENAQGKILHAYLVYPPNFDASQTYPAALVFHAWNGMSQEPVYFADLLAKEGYIVMAPDLFRNVATSETNLPWNIINTLVTPQERMNADIDTAITYLTRTKNVDKTRIFSGPGFCFGGSQAVTLGIRRPMAGTITLYGANIDALQDGGKDKLWSNLGAGGTSVLGIYGDQDGNPSPATAMGFESALTFRGISNTVTIYEGVGHAFVNPIDHSNGEQQAVAAWNQVVAWINEQSNTPQGRRALDVEEAPAATLQGRPTLSWLWDHAMDLVYGKGHFGHGLRHLQKASHVAGHNVHAKHASTALRTAPSTTDDEEEEEDVQLHTQQVHVRDDESSNSTVAARVGRAE